MLYPEYQRSPETKQIDLRLVLSDIRRYCAILTFDNDIANHAHHTFQQTYDALRLKNRHAVIASCIFMCREDARVTVLFDMLLKLVRVPLEQGLMVLLDVERFYSPELVCKGFGRFRVEVHDDAAAQIASKIECVAVAPNKSEVRVTSGYSNHDRSLLELCWIAVHAPPGAPPFPVSPKDTEYTATDEYRDEESASATGTEAEEDTDWAVVEAEEDPGADSDTTLVDTDWELLSSDSRSSVGNG